MKKYVGLIVVLLSISLLLGCSINSPETNSLNQGDVEVYLVEILKQIPELSKKIMLLNCM